MRRLRVKPYVDQVASWPDRGKVILAQYDDESVVVYQAYRRGIARYAVEHQGLGGPGFSLDRMSWIKTNFLWMMSRSEWGTARDQEAVLALWLSRPAFDSLLAQAVHSKFIPEVYESEAAWQRALQASEVRLQWDPDHPPSGPKLARRAIQLGLRGETLRCFAQEWLLEIQDVSDFVREQAKFAAQKDLLFTPAERIYPVKDQAVARRLGLDKSAP